MSTKSYSALRGSDFRNRRLQRPVGSLAATVTTPSPPTSGSAGRDFCFTSLASSLSSLSRSARAFRSAWPLSRASAASFYRWTASAFSRSALRDSA